MTIALGIAACTPKSVKKYDPFKIPRDEFYGTLKVVAVAPFRAPSDLQDGEAVKARFTALVIRQLEQAGLQVVPPDVTGPVLSDVMATGGGIYDPVTGKADEAKAKAAGAEVLRRLKEEHAADALLRVDLRVVSAVLSHDMASWDGVTDNAGTGFWKTFLSGSHSGRVPALSIVARLQRVDGVDLYANAGGLRVINRIGVGGKVEPIPHAELFADEARNENAVHLALDPLLGVSRPEKPDGGM